MNAVPVSVDTQLKGSLPIYGGIPLPQGLLYSRKNLNLLDFQGNAIPFQTQILSAWADSSIKWLLLDFIDEFTLEDNHHYNLQISKSKLQLQSSGNFSWVLQENDKVVVTGEHYKFEISSKFFDLFHRLWCDINSDGNYSSDEILSSAGKLFIKFNDELFSANLPEELTVEELGDIKAVIKISGWYINEKGKPFCKYIVRLTAYRQLNVLGVSHTIIYTGYPANNYGPYTKNRSLPDNETVQQISLVFPFKLNHFSFGVNSKIYSAKLNESINLLQKDDERYVVSSAKYKKEITGKMDGKLVLENDQIKMQFDIDKFWQQFPKAFQINQNEIMIHLLPDTGSELDLQTEAASRGPDAVARGSAYGLAKTHHLTLSFSAAQKKSETKATFIKPVLLKIDPQWIEQCNVIPGLPAYSSNNVLEIEQTIAELFNWAVRQQKNFRWYGMLDFGDVRTWYRQENGKTDWHPQGRWGWYNCEAMGLHSGILLQYLRTGNIAYFDFAQNFSRHLMDVDVVHYNTIGNDPRLVLVLDEQLSLVGSMHRHNYNHWGGRNDEVSHTNVFGILLYYYITGELRAKDVLLEIGQFLQKKPLSYYGHPDIVPSRNLGNLLWGDVLLYQFTSDPVYKTDANWAARILIDGQQEDGSWQETYNPVNRSWKGKPQRLFMTAYILPALIAYHQITPDESVKQAIIKATDYLRQTEKYLPFVDALAYCYYLTGNQQYLSQLKDQYRFVVSKQNRSADPLMRGLIFDKIIYHRPNLFLYSLPLGLKPLIEEVP